MIAIRKFYEKLRCGEIMLDGLDVIDWQKYRGAYSLGEQINAYSRFNLQRFTHIRQSVTRSDYLRILRTAMLIRLPGCRRSRFNLKF